MAGKAIQEDVAQGDIQQPRVICVVVNWNGWQDTLECLASLRRQDYAALEVIVVDNGSTNASVERIREAHPWVDLIEMRDNLGFASGCNVGTRAAYTHGADFVWLLNNDTVAPPDTASKLVTRALAHPEAGAIGSRIYFLQDPSKVQAWGGGKINLRTGYVSHFTAPASFDAETTYFTGASLLLPRRICELVGIFFEGFFMYCDDSDLCLRIHKAGYSLVMAEDTAILHKEGGSSPKRSPRIDQFATTANLWLLRRHAVAPVISQSVYLLLRLLNRIRRREWEKMASVVRGLLVYIRQRKQLFSDRL